MDHHHNLYKNQRSHTPRLHNKLNRELVDNNRAKQRRDRFQNSRNVFLSPERKIKKEILIPLTTDNTENNETSPKQTLLAKIVCNASDPDKLEKQEAYIKRFIEWKNAKKREKNVEKKKPFITSSNGGRQTAASSSLVPRGHHKEFRPPVGLKTVDQTKEVTENKNPIIKGRSSIYTVVPTPTKKQQQEKTSKGTLKPTKPISLEANTLLKSASKSKNSNNINNKTPGTVKSLTANMLSSNKNDIVKNAKNRTASKNVISKTPVNTNAKTTKLDNKKTPAKNTLVKVAKVLERSKSKVTPVAQPPKKYLKPRALKMPPPPSTKPVAASVKIAPGAAGKFKALAQKNVENVKAPVKSARLGQSFKAKKPLNKKANLPALKIKNVEEIISIINEPNEKFVIQTPRDFATLNNPSEFVTSTKIKDSSQNFKIDGISPIEFSPKKTHSNSSAKRKLLVKECNQQKAQKETRKEDSQNIKRFNFLRYSEVKNTSDNGCIKGAEVNERDGLDNIQDVEIKEKNLENLKRFNFLRYSDAANTSINDRRNEDFELKEKQNLATNSDDEKTPVKFGPEERPANYLSPFVSVARGKVSLKAEKEKRNSVYLQNISDLKNPSTDINQSLSQHSVEVRRTLEAVRYFRKQLQDEIERLHQLCDIWEKFKLENIDKIQNANAEDMINVTTGQTRLLTSKKFMQFKGLIDRCEAGATGIGDVAYDGSEDTKPINSVDLEGFWSMLGLQIDNLDKRFETLNRWKANDWVDPDEIRPKKNNNLTKVKKPKAAPIGKSKPSSALQQMLRKMQAEMKKNKNKNDDTNDIIVLTSTNPNKKSSTNSSNLTNSQSPNTSESRRLSVTVKDRKLFSPSPTVISFSSPNRRASLRRRNSTLEHPKLAKHDLNTLEPSIDLRKTVLLNENSRRMSLNQRSPKTKTIDHYASPDNTIVNSIENNFSNKENIKVFENQHVQSTHSPDRTPVPIGRKSILKTPGTARSKLRNVIFNDKLRVKKFNFLINDDIENENANDTHEEDLAKSYEEELQNEDSSERTLTLRNRKVRLRPSCEIVIPRK